MNGIGVALAELHDAETDLALAFRAVARRQAADPGTRYPCRTFARQCDQRAQSVRELARRYARDLAVPGRAEAVADGVDGVDGVDGTVGASPERQPSAGGTGRADAPGLLLLHDLRSLCLQAQTAEVGWLLVGQAARAVRDRVLLDGVTVLHAEVGTQIKWLRTRLKEVAPQALASTS